MRERLASATVGEIVASDSRAAAIFERFEVDFCCGERMHDALLHAPFLGFVMAMIFGHAPVVFPALTGRPLPYDAAM